MSLDRGQGRGEPQYYLVEEREITVNIQGKCLNGNKAFKHIKRRSVPFPPVAGCLLGFLEWWHLNPRGWDDPAGRPGSKKVIPRVVGGDGDVHSWHSLLATRIIRVFLLAECQYVTI